MGLAQDASSGTQPGDDPERVRLLDALSTRTSRAPIELARAAGLSDDRVRSLLGTLSLDGIAERRDDGWVRAGE